MTNMTMESPIGRLKISASSKGITEITWNEYDKSDNATPDPAISKMIHSAILQLTEYFKTKRSRFDLPLDMRGTEFQRRVWQELLKIPHGETRSYGDIAKSIGQPLASRAVGLANGKNPLPIVVPCHRVIGANGKLTGFAGGLERKAFLLELERRLHTQAAGLFDRPLNI